MKQILLFTPGKLYHTDHHAVLAILVFVLVDTGTLPNETQLKQKPFYFIISVILMMYGRRMKMKPSVAFIF